MTASQPTTSAKITEDISQASASAAPMTVALSEADRLQPSLATTKDITEVSTSTPSITATLFVGMMGSRGETPHLQQVQIPMGSNHDHQGVDWKESHHWIIVQMVYPGVGAREYPYRASDIDLVRSMQQEAEWLLVPSLLELRQYRSTPFKLEMIGEGMRISILTHVQKAPEMLKVFGSTTEDVRDYLSWDATADPHRIIFYSPTLVSPFP